MKVEELEVHVDCSENCYTAASGVGGQKCGCSRWEVSGRYEP